MMGLCSLGHGPGPRHEPFPALAMPRLTGACQGRLVCWPSRLWWLILCSGTPPSALAASLVQSYICWKQWLADMSSATSEKPLSLASRHSACASTMMSVHAAMLISVISALLFSVSTFSGCAALISRATRPGASLPSITMDLTGLRSVASTAAVSTVTPYCSFMLSRHTSADSSMCRRDVALSRLSLATWYVSPSCPPVRQCHAT
mmetsp:Transcript_20360/g.51583  ORF Transcript_20360/g.51583 Transcript_20360/m.51583 type:complete len:205 (+) Transcript_20360:223-837(+)